MNGGYSIAYVFPIEENMIKIKSKKSSRPQRERKTETETETETETKKVGMHSKIEAEIPINISTINMARFKGQRFFVHGYNQVQAGNSK